MYPVFSKSALPPIYQCVADSDQSVKDDEYMSTVFATNRADLQLGHVPILNPIVWGIIGP